LSQEGERALRHAVRVRVVFRYLGELSLVLGLTALVPVVGAVVFGELSLLVPFGVAGMLLVGVGVLAHRLPPPPDLQHNEALVVTAAAFILGSLVMSGTLAFQGIPWADAMFEAVSGVTTTGLSTLGSLDGRPQTLLLARAWMQWVGGLGFVVLSLALAFEAGFARRRLGAPSMEPGEVGGGVRAHARRVLVVYLVLTGTGVIALLLLGASGFDAVVYALAAVSTGGFAPKDGSLAPFGPALQYGVLGLSILGAVSLPLYWELGRGRWRRICKDAEARTLVVLILVIGSLLFAATHLAPEVLRLPLSDISLLAISAQTTTGFSTVAVDQLPGSAKTVLILSMITGGCHGSTAGGIKLLRILVVVRLVQWLITQTRLPASAVSSPMFCGERLEPAELLRAVVLVLLFVAVVAVSWLPFLAFGYAPLDALFEVVSATGTVGLSVGIARPELEPLLKGLLCLNMLVGRLEVFAILVMLSPLTWIGRRRS